MNMGRLRTASLSLLLVLAAGIGAAPTQGSVYASDQCAVTEWWQFSPALSTNFSTGTLTVGYNSTCVHESGFPTGLSGQSGSTQFSYSGSCITADIWNNQGETGKVVGGMVGILTGPVNDSVNVLALSCANIWPQGAGVAVSPSII